MAQTWRKKRTSVKLYEHQVEYINRRIADGKFASFSHALRVMIDFYKAQTGDGYYTKKVLPEDLR